MTLVPFLSNLSPILMYLFWPQRVEWFRDLFLLRVITVISANIKHDNYLKVCMVPSKIMRILVRLFFNQKIIMLFIFSLIKEFFVFSKLVLTFLLIKKITKYQNPRNFSRVHRDSLTIFSTYWWINLTCLKSG